MKGAYLFWLILNGASPEISIKASYRLPTFSKCVFIWMDYLWLPTGRLCGIVSRFFVVQSRNLSPSPLQLLIRQQTEVLVRPLDGAGGFLCFRSILPVELSATVCPDQTVDIIRHINSVARFCPFRLLFQRLSVHPAQLPTLAVFGSFISLCSARQA